MKAIEKLNALDNEMLQNIREGFLPPNDDFVFYGTDVNSKKECNCTGTGDNRNNVAKCTCSDEGCKKDGVIINFKPHF